MRLTNCISAWGYSTLALVALSQLGVPTMQANEGRITSDWDEFKIKRKEVFEFAQKPSLKIDGDRVAITFESKDYCDATVVIENQNRQIVRHLACGVLGDNAPEPFQQGALKQTIVWDGKDDTGSYIDDKESHSVRVSLGLTPRFEKTLFWHPKKRNGIGRMPLIVPQPEGVYVYEGDGVEQIKRFTHDGRYDCTVYPFPADKVKDVKGLEWAKFSDGFDAPVKQGYWRSTFLAGGLLRTDTGPGSSGTALAVRNGHIASVGSKVCRLKADGSSGELKLYGPTAGIAYPRSETPFYPKSAAFSLDNKYLYFTGYYQNTEFRLFGNYPASIFWDHGVFRVKYEEAEGAQPERWLGRQEPGNGADAFEMPTSICVDNQGNVYVADNRNDRIQVFSPEGRLVKSIPVDGPAIIQLHHETQELYVFSWGMSGLMFKPKPVKAMLRVFGPLRNPQRIAEIPLPLQDYRETGVGGRGDEVPYRMALDSWTDPPTIWMCTTANRRGRSEDCGIKIFAFDLKGKEQLALKQNWQKEVIAGVSRWRSATLARQRLFVDPRSGALYVAEGDSSTGKTFTELIKIDPDSGKIELVKLPFSSEDMAIDIYGHAYLRVDTSVARFDLQSWREVPFDYGEERKVQFASDAKGAELVGALVTPGGRPVYWHQSGMDVNFKGDLIVSCFNSKHKEYAQDGKNAVVSVGKPYTPRLYPGRYRYGELHIWDRHGQVKSMDAVPGVPDGHGTFIDQYGDIYLLVAGRRLMNGKEPFGSLTGTVVKCKPGKGRFVSDSEFCPVKLTNETQPDEHVNLSGDKGRMWVQGAEWMYSGIGFVLPGAPCQCWNARFALDFLGRSFAPETVRSQIAVLDSNGNLMMHIGRYGNVDSDGAKSKVPLGGDEVGLVYANYVASHTDKRLFIADAGNQRIVSVALDYGASEAIPLKGIQDRVP